MGAISSQSMPITIWPRILSASRTFRFMAEDIPRLREAFSTHDDFFGLSMRFFSGDDCKLIATNRISAWTTSPGGRAAPCGAAGMSLYGDLLLSLLNGTPEAMYFAAKEALRAAPPTPHGRDIELVVARDAIMITDLGCGLARPQARPDRQVTTEVADHWQRLRGEHDLLDAAGHAEACRGTKIPHFGASAMTALVAPPDSNHHRIEWLSKSRMQIEQVLAHHAAIMRTRFALHPDWQMPGTSVIA